MNKLPALLILFSLVTLPGCKQSVEELKPIDLTPQDIRIVLNPTGHMKDAELRNVEGKVITSSRTTETFIRKVSVEDKTIYLDLTPGTYKVELKVDLFFKRPSGRYASTTLLKELPLKVESGGQVTTAEISLDYTPSAGDFLIEELYLNGTRHAPSPDPDWPGNLLIHDPYKRDKYVIITNNSDETLYADGLIFFESLFSSLTTIPKVPKYDRTKSTAVKAAFAIPGSGTDHPVGPGKSVILAADGIDHREYEPEAANLSDADFEWISEGLRQKDSLPWNRRVDDLMDLRRLLALKSTGIWEPDNTDSHSYGIAYSEMDPAKFGVKYGKTYKEDGQDRVYILIPNEWILDCVNLSTKKGFKTLPVDGKLDAGWVEVFEPTPEPKPEDKDKVIPADHFTHCVRRKVSADTGKSRKVLVDSNDSSRDMLGNQPPSLSIKAVADYK